MTLKSCKILFTYCTKLVQLISFHRHTICTSTSTPTIADTLISANQPRELLLSIQLVRCLYSPNNSLLSHCSIIAITLSDLAGSIYQIKASGTTKSFLRTPMSNSQQRHLVIYTQSQAPPITPRINTISCSQYESHGI